MRERHTDGRAKLAEGVRTLSGQVREMREHLAKAEKALHGLMLDSARGLTWSMGAAETKQAVTQLATLERELYLLGGAATRGSVRAHEVAQGLEKPVAE